MTKLRSTPRIATLCVLLSLFALPSLLAAQVQTVDASPQEPQQSTELVLLSRHDAVIIEAFAEKFLASSYATDAGVTDVTYKAYTTFTAWEKALESTTTAIDLAWGGGPTLFNQLDELDLLAPITDQDLLDIVNETVPMDLAGAEMRKYNAAEELIWVANAISSFGFTVNLDVLERFNLETPTKWMDLASPDFFVDEVKMTVAMGNAPQTTSNTRIYQIMLQKFGWDEAWRIMSQMAANGGIFGESVPTRAAVIQGQVAAAMTIDFYGIIAMAENPKCVYVIPENGSIVNGDPLAFGKNGNCPAGAKAFFEYLNSAEGQAEWILNDRLPIYAEAFNTPEGQSRPDVIDLYDATMANQGIEFNEPLAMSQEFTMMDYFEQTITENHPELKQAWSLLVTKYKNGEINETAFNAKMQEACDPLITLDEAVAMNAQMKSDTSFRQTKTTAWRDAAETRYNDLYVDLGGTIGGDGDDDEFAPFNFLMALFGMLGAAAVVTTMRRRRR